MIHRNLGVRPKNQKDKKRKGEGGEVKSQTRKTIEKKKILCGSWKKKNLRQPGGFCKVWGAVPGPPGEGPYGQKRRNGERLQDSLERHGKEGKANWWVRGGEDSEVGNVLHSRDESNTLEGQDDGKNCQRRRAKKNQALVGYGLTTEKIKKKRTGKKTHSEGMRIPKRKRSAYLPTRGGVAKKMTKE